MPRPSSDMPLFSTPMIRPPMIAPVTVPMPPVTAAPPMKAAAMASSSKPVPAPGQRRVAAGGEGDAGDAGQHAHVHEQQEVDPLGVDAGQLRGVQVAAPGVDVAAEDELVHDRAVDQDQRGQDDQDDRGAAVAGQDEGDGQDEHGGEDRLDEEPRARLVLEAQLDPLGALADLLAHQADGRREAEEQVSGSNVGRAAAEVGQEAGADRDVRVRERRDRPLLRTIWVRPRNVSMPARVTMNAGMPT